MHYSFMLSKVKRGVERASLLSAVGRIARVGADPIAFALLLEHAGSVEELRDLWTEMSETGPSQTIISPLFWRQDLFFGRGS